MLKVFKKYAIKNNQLLSRKSRKRLPNPGKKRKINHFKFSDIKNLFEKHAMAGKFKLKMFIYITDYIDRTRYRPIREKMAVFRNL